MSQYNDEINEYNNMRQLNKLLNFQNKEEYKEEYKKEYVKEFYNKNGIEYIPEIEEYFKTKCVWINWYDFIGYDTSIFIQNKDDWITFCKEHNINSLKKYYELCILYKQLPKNPADFYIDFMDINYELDFRRNRRGYKIC